MNRVIFASLLLSFFSFGDSDRWDITETSEMKEHQYRYIDVSPTEARAPARRKADTPRGPASVVPFEKAFEKDSHQEERSMNKFSIIASNEQFLPNIIRIPFQTEVEITLLTSELESCFIMADLGIRRGLKKDHVSKIIIPPQSEVKEYDFHCAIQNIHGKIIVEPPKAKSKL